MSDSRIEVETLSGALTRCREGWYTAAADTPAVSYPSQAHDVNFALEEQSFWFIQRNAMIEEVTRRFPPGKLVLDIGGGNGFVARRLQEIGHRIVLLEPGEAGAGNALRRGVDCVVKSDLASARFFDRAFAGATMCDVLEHIDPAARLAVLSEVRRVLAEEGRLFITVPALPLLWSREDELAGHYTRYTRATLAEQLDAAGFTVEFVTYFFSALILPILLSRVLMHRHAVATDANRAHRHADSLPARAIGAVSHLERRLVRRGWPVPVGSSLLAVARRAP